MAARRFRAGDRVRVKLDGAKGTIRKVGTIDGRKRVYVVELDGRLWGSFYPSQLERSPDDGPEALKALLRF